MTMTNMVKITCDSFMCNEQVHTDHSTPSTTYIDLIQEFDWYIEINRRQGSLSFYCPKHKHDVYGYREAK